ncbi:hypothetical protein AUJ46_00800 [Candidatus Peregrinibacteria bacterium CG1_02_54_53]|nr:MAG: hypothetical protein AUJ46_00800 [Candidatus Peregrinibacteria bacterium CG1_02_54_53]
MDTPKKIARPLFVIAFTIAAAFFAAINVNEQVRASVSGFLAFTTATPSKGICWVGGAPDVPQTYTQADVGQGYAKVQKGTNFTTSAALKAACTEDDYDALRSLYCEQNPGTHFFKNIAMYGQDDKYILYSMDCGPDCNWYDCSEIPPGASSSASSSSAPSTAWKGICDVRNSHTNLPSYADEDSGRGYAKVNKGTNFASLNAISAACTQADYDALGRTFCAQNPGGSYQREVGMFDQDDNYHSNSCGNFGCEYVQCPASSSSSLISTFKGACVVRDSYTDLPSYNDPDAKDGYVKMGKGTNFVSIDDVRDRCTQDDYEALGEKFCAVTPGGSYQMQVATYHQNNRYKSTGCGNFGCDYVTCPEGSSASTEEDSADTDDSGEEMTPPPAGFEEEVITNTVANKTLPPAKYEDDVLTDIAAYKNPFPDTDLDQLIGKAAAELYRRAAIGGFPDGQFKSDRPVNRAEAAKFLLLTRSETVKDANNNGRFPDVIDGQWYTKFVITAANKGIIKGYPDGTFRPADQVKTAEFLKMLSLTFGLELKMDYGYSDVPADSWFAPYAGIAQEYNLFPDRESSLLSPEKPLSRGDVAVAIYQYLANR